MNSRLQLLIPILIFCLIFVIHTSSPLSNRGDSRHVLHITYSLIRERNTNLDEYISQINAEGFTETVNNVNGHWFSYYPVGTSLLVYPYINLIDNLLPWLGFDKYKIEHFLLFVWADHFHILLASIIVSITSVVVYWICRFYLNQWLSLIPTLIFAFGTTMWSIASRSLLQHGPSALFAGLSLLLLLKIDKNSKKINLKYFMLLGLVLAFRS